MLTCHVVHHLHMLACSLYRREAPELQERKKGLKREVCFAFCIERGKSHRDLRKHVLQHESNFNTPKYQVLRHPDYRDKTYSNVNPFGTTQIFLRKAFQRTWTRKPSDLMGRLVGQTTCSLNLENRD